MTSVNPEVAERVWLWYRAGSPGASTPRGENWGREGKLALSENFLTDTMTSVELQGLSEVFGKAIWLGEDLCSHL